MTVLIYLGNGKLNTIAEVREIVGDSGSSGELILTAEKGQELYRRQWATIVKVEVLP